MSDLDSEAETIIQDYDLDAPPHQVWRALTEPELLAAWLGPNDFRAEVGQRFRVEAAPGTDAAVECEVLEVEPNRILTYSWREERESGAALDSEVTWILTPRFDGGTHLRLVQDGFALSGGRVLAVAGAGLSRILAWRVLGRLADNFRLAA
jgi:uncharacterized protein YndB with AHSA1/START domain